MAAPKINLARGLNFGMNFDTSSFDGAVKSVSTSLTKLGSEFKSFGDDMSKHMDKMTKSITALDKGLKKLAESTKEASGAGGGLGGIAGMFTKALGALGSVGGGVAGAAGGSFLGPLGAAIGGPLMSALGGALTGAVSFAVTQAIGILQRGIEWQKGFTNIGRMIPTSQLTPELMGTEKDGKTTGVLGIHKKMLEGNVIPGFPLEEQMDVANRFVSLGKRRGYDIAGSKGMGQLEDLTKTAGVAGQATGMGTDRTAEILMEQSRSFAMTLPQMKEYADTMSAVSRVSGMNAEQMSGLNDATIAMGRSFGKTGDEAKKFASDAILVGGELSLMGFNVGDMFQKMNQQASGSEAGLLQSLILGSKAGTVDRFKSVQDVSKQIIEMAAGMPEQFREYFMTQIAGPMGLPGFTAADITQVGMYANEEDMKIAKRRERLEGEGINATSEDYLSQIAKALADPEKFFKPAAAQIQNVLGLIENKLTTIGTDWATKLGSALKENMPKISEFIDRIGTLISDITDKIGSLVSTLIPKIINLLSDIAGYLRAMSLTKITEAMADTITSNRPYEYDPLTGEYVGIGENLTEKSKSKQLSSGIKPLSEKLKERDMIKLIEDAAKQKNVSENLLKAVGKTESDYNPNAISNKGAVGLLQLTEATAKDVGLTSEQRMDPKLNALGGATYLKTQLDKYKDTDKALAAYNMGPGGSNTDKGLDAVLRRAESTHTPWQKLLPKETKDYIAKVRAEESRLGTANNPMHVTDDENKIHTAELQKIANRPATLPNLQTKALDPSELPQEMLGGLFGPVDQMAYPTSP